MLYHQTIARSRAVHSRHPHPAATEWSCLLLHHVICSYRVTVHFQWGGNLSLVPLTFDLDIQTRLNEGPNTSSV